MITFPCAVSILSRSAVIFAIVDRKVKLKALNPSQTNTDSPHTVMLRLRN